MNLNVFNTNDFLITAGYVGLFSMVFAETGLLIGLVLPGESLLFTAGFLSSLGYLNIWIVIPVAFIAAVLADNLGYALGKKYGRSVFDKKHSFLFNQSYIDKAENLYRKHGGKTLISARFLPFIRTLAPLFAGIAQMKYKTFLLYNLVGALLWTLTISLLAYFLGQAIPNAEKYIFVIAAAAVLVFSLPSIISALRKI